MSARRSRSSSPRAATRPRTRPNWSMVELEELPAVIDPEAALRPDGPIVHDRFDTNLIGEFSVGQGRGRGRARGRAAPARAPLLSPPLCRGADGVPRRRQPSMIRAPIGDDLVRDPGRALGAPRSRGAARPAGSARALRRARCRRRFRRQGPRLSRGPAGHRSSPARSAGRCAGSRTGAST